MGASGLDRTTPGEPQLGTRVRKLQLLMANLATAPATVAIGTNAAKVRTTTTATYLINGVFKSKASTDDFWTLSGANVPDGKASKWLLMIDAAGAASVAQGSIETTAAKVKLPNLPASKAVLGILTVENASGANFVPGTTLLSAAGITDTYTDGPAAIVEVMDP